jgi:type IX secretion system PorP/SprF family membrane protein
MNMIRFYLILFLTLLFKITIAQYDEQFSQYMYNQLDYNPGSAGSKEAICLSALSRQQWVGFGKGAPTTSVFSANMPIKLINSGIGLTVVNDVIGFNNNLGLKIDYAYRMDVNNGMGKIAFGISGGFLNNTLKGAKWTFPADESQQDGSVPSTDDSGMAFDLGLGIFYKTENLYLGVSSTHILQPSIKYKNSNSATFLNSRHYFLTAGYNLGLKNPLFDFQPSLLIVSDGSSSSVDLNSVILYNKRIWGGVTYRVKSAVIGMIGIELMSGLKIGYSYDFSTTDLSKYNNGSHELMVSYCFTIAKEKIPHKSKSVRFL